MSTEDILVVLKPDEVMAEDGSWQADTVSAIFTRLYLMATQNGQKQRLIIEVDITKASTNPLLTVV